ncbi:MAG TPA: hypothetical protein P5123_13060, partial [Spirochaetota bacterium]|nr:hypothetical protein [Spirochaetota bacterium]
GWNRYMYCAGNPVLYKDPSGHSWQTMQQEFRKGILDSQDTDSRLQTEQKLFDLERTGVDCVDSLKSKLHDNRVESGWSTDMKGADQSALDSYIEDVYKGSTPWFAKDKSNGPVKPVDHPNAYVSSGYYRNDKKWKPALHGAIDVSTGKNEGVQAKAMWKVKLVYKDYQTNKSGTSGYGNRAIMEILEGQYKGSFLLYGHLAKPVAHEKGAVIQKGEEVGIVGGTGRKKGYPIRRSEMFPLNKIKVISIVIIMFVFVITPAEDSNNLYKKLEQRIVEELGNGYEIIRKEKIHFKENKDVFIDDYKDKRASFNLKAFDVYQYNGKFLIACACINTVNRDKKAAVIIFDSDLQFKKLIMKQVIWKKVYDLFPSLYKVNNAIILDIWYKNGTDWVDSYEFDTKNNNFKQVPSAMDTDWPI